MLSYENTSINDREGKVEDCCGEGKNEPIFFMQDDDTECGVNEEVPF